MAKVKGIYKKPVPPQSPLEVLDEKINSIANKVEDIVVEKEQEISVVIQRIDEVEKMIETIELKHGENGEDGKDGENGQDGADGQDAEPVDLEEIIHEVLERIDVPQAPTINEESIVSKLLEKVPKPIDENKLLAKFLKQIPEKKGSLKIIQEKIETDPMSVIDQIMAMPEGKFKLKTTHIDGLEQTISAFHSQLGRGYLHGGGISNITGLIQAGTNISITGTGTSTSPYVINATGSSAVSLADVSASSTTTPLSLYTMTSGVNVEFRSSTGVEMLALEGNDTICLLDSTVTFLKTLSGTSTTSNFLNVTGTLNSTNVANPSGVLLTITSAGSSSLAQRALRTVLAAGYTGSSQTNAGSFLNQSAGTGVQAWGNASGNFGSVGQVTAVTAGANTGLAGSGGSSSLMNAGVTGVAISSTSTPALNLGVGGLALNGTKSIAGYFGLYSNQSINGSSIVVGSTALVADNGATGNNIFAGLANNVLTTYIDGTGNLGFGINADKTISVDRNTISNTAGKTLTISSGSATSGATDKSSTLALATGITTGGAIGKINFNVAGIQTTGTGGILQVQQNGYYDPIYPYTQDYVAGDVLTMAGFGSGTATITIDSVDFNGVPITWTVSNAGSGYAYGDNDAPTGGSGTGADFSVTRISGTSDNSISTVGYADYNGITANNFYTNGRINAGFTTDGSAFTDTSINVNGAFNQYDYNAIGQVNKFTSRMLVGTNVDVYGALYGSKLTVSTGVNGLQLDSTTDQYPILFTTNQTTFASKLQLYRDGQLNLTGSFNSPFGGFGRIQNLLTYSESPANAAWSKLRLTATDNAVLGPDGVTTNGASLVANAVNATHYVRQTTASLPVGTYTFSCWLKAAVKGDNLSVTYGVGGSSGSQFSNIGTDWSYYSLTYTTASVGTHIVGFQPNTSTTYYMAGASLVESSSAGLYYKTTATTKATAESLMYTNYNIGTQGKISLYNNLATVSNGVASCLATVDLTAQGAAIAATTAYTTVNAGMYEVSFVATITRAATTSSVLGGAGGFQFVYTDADDSVVKTTPTAMFLTSVANTTATTVSGVAVVYAKAATNIQYVVGYTSVGATSMQYNYHVKVKAL
jgi:hypothetical protein